MKEKDEELMGEAWIRIFNMEKKLELADGFVKGAETAIEETRASLARALECMRAIGAEGGGDA